VRRSINSSTKKLAIYFAPNVNRSTIIARALHQGARALAGHYQVEVRPGHTYRGRPDCDAAIFYGFAGGLRQVFDDYRAKRKAIYVDLGYFGRRKRTRFDGYHKLVLNSRHPTDYFQIEPHSSDRFDSFAIPILPWREAGRHILVVGMSGKAAAAEGLGAEAWERETVAQLRKITKRPIVYRPKPNWADSRPITGALYAREQPLEEAFADCHAIVSHHSNVAVDALLAGIPCICPGGVASVLSGHDLSQIETPPMLDGRAQWAADLAHTQYSIEEMQSGIAFRYLLSEGLL
jgi:hypothetical protein